MHAVRKLKRNHFESSFYPTSLHNCSPALPSISLGLFFTVVRVEYASSNNDDINSLLQDDGPGIIVLLAQRVAFGSRGVSTLIRFRRASLLLQSRRG